MVFCINAQFITGILVIIPTCVRMAFSVHEHIILQNLLVMTKDIFRKYFHDKYSKKMATYSNIPLRR